MLAAGIDFQPSAEAQLNEFETVNYEIQERINDVQRQNMVLSLVSVPIWLAMTSYMIFAAITYLRRNDDPALGHFRRACKFGFLLNCISIFLTTYIQLQVVTAVTSVERPPGMAGSMAQWVIYAHIIGAIFAGLMVLAQIGYYGLAWHWAVQESQARLKPSVGLTTADH
jgi:hypothetical protein